jgi:hypothetical protein
MLKKAMDSKLSDTVSDIIVKKRTENESGFEWFVSRAIVDSFTFEEISRSQGSIQINDKKLIILQEEIAVIPKIGFLVSICNIDYRIHDVSEDPSSSIWELVVRV